MSWDFVLDILNQMGFSSRWCGCIRGALISLRSSILINGSPTEEFDVFRGLRQGDPLSPFLFVVVMEGFHMGMVEASRAGFFKGVHIDGSTEKFRTSCMLAMVIC